MTDVCEFWIEMDSYYLLEGGVYMVRMIGEIIGSLAENRALSDEAWGFLWEQGVGEDDIWEYADYAYPL